MVVYGQHMPGRLTIRETTVLIEANVTPPPDSESPLHFSLMCERSDGTRYIEIINEIGSLTAFHAFLEERRVVGTAMLALYSVRLYRRDAPRVYGELRWHRAFGFRKYIGGVERAHTRRDVARVQSRLKYLDALQASRGGGRPLKFPTPERYAAEIRKVYARAERSGWDVRGATDAQLAKWLRCSKNTLYACERLHGVSPDDIRNRRA